jgi:transcriptional regulator with XRE-family HTH domain
MNMEKATTPLKSAIYFNGYSMKEFAKKADISIVTLRKYVNEPSRMNGDMRKKVSEILQVDIETVDAICNGRSVKFVTEV